MFQIDPKRAPDQLDWLGAIASEDPEDPRPFLLSGVRVAFVRIGIKAVRAARGAARVSLGVAPDDIEEAGDELSRALLRRGIRAWEGVGDLDGEVLPVTIEAVDAFLADPVAYEAADKAYVIPWTTAQLPGKGSAPSQNGTGAGATPATDTASSPAGSPATSGATSASTRSTNRPAKPRKRSGKSSGAAAAS